MATNKKPGSCRKYRDKISAHTKHQNKTETDFSKIMAEMQALKQNATKPVPFSVIDTQNSQGHFYSSLPNLNQYFSQVNQSETSIGNNLSYTQPYENQTQDTSRLSGIHSKCCKSDIFSYFTRPHLKVCCCPWSFLPFFC